MRNLLFLLSILVVTLFFTGCGPTQSNIALSHLYPKVYNHHPKSILVLPAKNTTTSVDATDYFSHTIALPLAEKGYYVFPVHLVDSFFKSENLSDPELIRNISVSKLKEIFNPDAILYVDINAWDTGYSVVSSHVDVGLSFSLIDANTGDEIWQNNAYAYSYNGMDGNNGIIGLVVSAITTALNTATDYTQLSSVANIYGTALMPVGPYHKKYKIDGGDKITLYDDSELKDGRLYVNEYFIKGNGKEEKTALTTRGYLKGYHAFSVTSFNFFNHNGYTNYYITQEIKGIKHLRNRFFKYENNKPYLISSGKKVFVYAESDGKIPYSEENGNYYFQIQEIVDLTIDSK